MKTWLLLLLLSMSLPGWRWLTRVRDHNEAQHRGELAAGRGQAAEAAYYFGQAVALSGRQGAAPALLLGLAQAQARAGQLGRARTTYAQLLGAAVPVALGSVARQQLAVLLARQGQVAQAIGLLRQALRLDPGNAAARFDYEALSAYLAGQRPPAGLPPPSSSQPNPTKADAEKPTDSKPEPAPAAEGGTSPRRQPQGQPGTAPNATRPEPADAGPAAPTPSAAGQPDQLRPPTGANGEAGGGTSSQGSGAQPGTGTRQPLPSGTAPGRQRGLDRSQAAGGATPPGRHGGQPGTEAATEADAQLQTQRERLKALNLSPAQAQQLLDALRASEEQYLQQRPRARQGAAPAPGVPTW